LTPRHKDLETGIWTQTLSPRTDTLPQAAPNANGKLFTSYSHYSHEAGDGMPPQVVQFADWPGELCFGRLDAQVLAADASQKRAGDPKEFGALEDFDRVERRRGNDDSALGFAKEQGIESRSGSS